MSDTGLLWLRLYRTPGLGPKRLHGMYQKLGGRPLTESDLDRLNADEWRKKLHHKGIPSAEAVAAEYERLRNSGVEVVHLGHPAYPPPALARLRNEAPPLLFCRGRVDLLSAPSVAVVGARHADARALAIAERLGKGLARQGWNVLSGYAAGVDDRAHLGALRAGGTTTLVLSMGILRFTPRASLRENSGDDERWLVISQFAPEIGWQARLAMTRNDLVCALAEAVVVVASGVPTPEKASGTFAAGLTALRLGVPLFVVRPEALGPEPPPGNAELLARGGTALDPNHLQAFFDTLKAFTRVPAGHGPAPVRRDRATQLSMWT
jgi:DNA processing protein